MTNLYTPNFNGYLLPENYNFLTPGAKELSRKLSNNMRSILLKGRNDSPNSDINSSNKLNKTKSDKYETVRPLSCKVKPFSRANLHVF